MTIGNKRCMTGYIAILLFLFQLTTASAQPGGCDAAKLNGNWILTGDNDGSVPNKDAVILLTFNDSKAHLKAVMGSNILESPGFFQACAGMITLEFDDFDFGCSYKGYHLDNNKLTLPFGVLGYDGTASYWQKEGSTSGGGDNDDGSGGGSSGSGSGAGGGSGSGSGNGDGHAGGSDNSGAGNQSGQGQTDGVQDKHNIKNYSGKWIGSGWGWEVRFKHTAGDFASQFSGVDKGSLPFENEKVIMSLLVEHATQFVLDVDDNGRITGEGTITYNLIPNLCGVAALTESVNSMINIMGKLTFIYQLGKSLGQAAISDFRLSSYEMEDKIGDLIGLPGKTALSIIMEKAGDELPAKMKNLNLSHQKQQTLCKCVAGVPSVTAGTKVGPSTAFELIESMGVDVAKGLFMDAALGGLPVGLMLSIPGVTQIQYHYKGMPDGPQTRKFNISGYVDESGSMMLEFDGFKKGDKNLYVEYEVNYKKERSAFPAWSPFTKEPGLVKPSGTLKSYEVENYSVKKSYRDEVTNTTKTITIPMQRPVEKTTELSSPFAQFHESGQQRNGVKVWHEYEYNWKAFRLIDQ